VIGAAAVDTLATLIFKLILIAGPVFTVTEVTPVPLGTSLGVVPLTLSELLTTNANDVPTDGVIAETDATAVVIAVEATIFASVEVKVASAVAVVPNEKLPVNVAGTFGFATPVINEENCKLAKASKIKTLPFGKP